MRAFELWHAYIFFLFMLQAFSGTQNVSNQQKEEAWRVNVQIQGVDLEHGYLCGTMEALNVPMADTPVIPLTPICLRVSSPGKRFLTFYHAC